MRQWGQTILSLPQLLGIEEGIWFLLCQNEQKPTLPVEAEATEWVTRVATGHGPARFVIESDAKTCIETLVSPSDEVHWRISVTSTDTLNWASQIQFLGVRWSPREGKRQPMYQPPSVSRIIFSGCFVEGSAPSVFFFFLNVILAKQAIFGPLQLFLVCVS